MKTPHVDPASLPPDELAVLRRGGILYLCALMAEACLETGWRRRGVRGWRFPDEVADLLSRGMWDVFPRLAKHGLVDRVDAAEARQARAVWMYRISAAGVRKMESLGGPAPVIPPPPLDHDADAGSVYLPPGSWTALQQLQRAAQESDGPLRFGEPGWRTSREVTRAAEVAVSQVLPHLLRSGLAEQRPDPAPGSGRRRSEAVYRATPRGLRMRFVDAVGLGGRSPTRVQVQAEGGA